MHPYLEEIRDANTLFIDTETDEHDKLWSLQTSVRPGTAAFIHRDQDHVIAYLRTLINNSSKLIVVHNAPFDLPVLKQVGIVPKHFADTMSMAYLLQSEPQGLKPLSYRHAGMEMSSFTDVTKDATRRKALLYLATAVELTWPDPEPILTFPAKGPKAGSFHIRNPQNIAKKIAGILRDATLKDADPYERWTKIKPEDGRAMVEEKLGVLHPAYLQDIPFEDAVYYSNRDPDATARVYEHLWPQIQDLGLEEAFWTDMAAMEICLDMMEAGILVDTDYLRNLSQFFDTKLTDISNQITSLTGKTINPRSYEQVSDLLFDDLGIKTIKRRNSKGYHPTGDEILAQLVTEHPVVQKIRDYREYAKYRSTYTETIPKQVGPDGRIHTTIKMTRTATGRLCVDPETLIEAPRDMENYPDGIPLRKLNVGDYVYSMDHNRELCIKRVKWVGPTKVAPTLKIRYKAEDESVKELLCSDDHLVRRYHGTWMHAKDLKVGNRLLCMPKRHNHGQGYYTFYPHSRARGDGQSSGGKVKEHRFIFSQLYYDGSHLGSKAIIHHIDGRPINNHPDNLKWLADRASHIGEHAYGIKGYEEAIRTGIGRKGNKLKASTVAAYKRRLRKIKVQGRNHVIVSIKPGPIMQLWDLEIEDTHCFIGNEVVLHNSSAEPNLQNIPVRKEDSRKIRNGFIAQEGCSLVAIDYSQIELKCFAHFSQDPELMDVYLNGGDIHTKTGCHTFQMTPEELPDYPHRRSAKTTNFSVVYETTARGLYEQLAKDGVEGWTLQDCQGFINSWEELYHGVFEYRKQIHSEARQHGYVRDLSGRIRYVPGVRCKSRYLVAEALRKAGNMPSQGTAAYVIKRAMAVIPPIYQYYRSQGYIFNPLIPVHDELIFEIQDDIIPEVVPIIKTLMENAVKLSVPVTCDVEVAKRWGELEHWEAPHD